MKRKTLIVLFCGLIFLSSFGCAGLLEFNISNDIKMEELYFHGKTGKVISTGSFPVALAADIVLLPITAPVGFGLTKFDCHGMGLIVIPGFIVQLTAWLAGETIMIPANIAFEYIPRKTKLFLASEEDIEYIIIGEMPYVSEAEYATLLMTTKKSNPPEYYPSAPWGEPYSFIFGFKPKIKKETMGFWK